MQKLQTVNADTLLYEPLEKPSFVVDGLIPTGLILFCGSQKIGKSWLMLKLCLCVSQGIPLWDMQTQEGDVLYLYHERMSARWNELERGQSSMETKRKHIPTWLYKLGGRLDKQYVEIVSALSDINAFNAGKKRDKALELLSAWLPNVEKFSKEIGKQQAYINSLKERIGQESDYAGRMRDEKYEQELKVQKANQRIFELHKTNEQMGRLLSKIPPDVLEELQKTGRTRQKER